MTNIFSRAFNVVIWLGTAKDLQHNRVDVKDFVAAFDSIVHRDRSPFTAKRAPSSLTGWRELSHRFHAYFYAENLHRILNARWFERVWVVQEVVLSPSPPTVLLGHLMCSFRMLYDATRLLQDHWPLSILDSPMPAETHFKGQRLLKQPKCRNRLVSGDTYFPELVKSQRFSNQPLANQLLYVFNLLAAKHVTIPHDSMYGALRLVKATELPPALKPDYRQHYHQVCRAYTIFLVNNTGKLGFIGTEKSEHDDFPSWVADIRGISPDKIECYTEHSGNFCPEGTILTVSGFPIRKVPMCLPRVTDKLQGRQAIRRGLNCGMDERLSRFCGSILATAATLQNEPLSDVWRDLLLRMAEDYAIPEELAQQCPMPSYFAQQYKSGTSNSSWNRKNRSRLLRAITGKGWAVEEDGNLYTCPMQEREKPHHDCELWRSEDLLINSFCTRKATTRTK